MFSSKLLNLQPTIRKAQAPSLTPAMKSRPCTMSARVLALSCSSVYVRVTFCWLLTA